MKNPFVHNTSIIFVAIGLIVVSTAALSYFSYHYTVGRENLLEDSLVQSNIKLALHSVDRIEQKIVDNDLKLSDMVDVNDPKKWPEMVEAVKKADLNVDQVYFLRPGSNYPVYPPYSYEIKNQWGAFRASFNVREIDVDHLVLNQPHHLHKERQDNYFFATFVLKETSKGLRYLVCFQMNLDKVTALLDKNLRDLQDRFYISIVDYENNGIYGQPLSRSSSKYFYETRFPDTLYKWVLQILPRKYMEIEQGVKNRRRINLYFIILSMSLIFISLAIIYVGWRHDRQLRRLKENFISNVSHELKTPLSLIRMFSEILIMGRVAAEDKKQEYYRIINNESDRMSRLINNLLDFANLIRGIEHKHFEKANISQLVTKALEAYGYEIQKDGFQLNLQTKTDIPDSFVDPNAITMAFLNLLDNSVKYSGDQKEIEVRIEQTNGFIDLSVVDKGIGIPISEQQRIFDKFYRGNDAAVRGIRGSGIGLSITKHVAEMHGGDILVKSEPGKGSTFTLRIPIRNTLDESKS
jgi:two-component system, OmpR family, phosphate regulon sensor histidine kinase PhoR